MNSKKQLSSNIWKALSNQIRRDLLVFIGEKRVVSFTDIQSRFGTKVGTLYHHLDTLGELITQNATKKYLLSEKGRRAYALIEDELDVSAPEIQAYGKLSFLHTLFLRSVFHLIYADSVRSLGFTLLLFVGLTVSTFFMSTSPVFLFPSLISPAYFAPIFFVVSTLVTYILCELFSSFLFKRKKEKLALFQSVVIVQIPLILFSVLESLVVDFDYPISPLDLEIWLFVILIFTQVITLGLLIEAIIVIKELRIEKAGIVALVTSYTLNGLAFLIMNGLVW